MLTKRRTAPPKLRLLCVEYLALDLTLLCFLVVRSFFVFECLFVSILSFSASLVGRRKADVALIKKSSRNFKKIIE